MKKNCWNNKWEQELSSAAAFQESEHHFCPFVPKSYRHPNTVAISRSPDHMIHRNLWWIHSQSGCRLIQEVLGHIG